MSSPAYPIFSKNMRDWFIGNSSLSWQDYSLLASLILISIFVGLFFGKEEKSTNDFFLGGRKISYWAASLSFVATEISAITMIAVPSTAYRENWEYMQFFIGSFAARVAIAFLFIPAFYHYNCTSIYEFLKHRFGSETQYAGSILFFVTRLLASGVRLMAASLAVSVLIGWHIIPTILLFSTVSIFYIACGGIKAIIWTNVLQALTFIVAGIVTIVFLATQIDGGMAALLQIAGDAGKLKIFHWGPTWTTPDFLKCFLTDPNIIWIAVLNGFFGSMAAFGTDQELMQRLLTVKTRRESQKTMLLTSIGSFLVLLIFLTIGAGLYTFYAQNPTLAIPEKLDKIFPHFITNSMPVFMRGLLLSAIVMASIDSPLGSLSSSFVIDIYKPLVNQSVDEKHTLLVSRISVILFGILLALIAYFFSHFDKILWLAFKIGGVTYGSLLGIFLLGLLTKRDSNIANVVGMTLSAFVTLTLLILSEMKMIPLGWTWLLLLGTFLTFSTGYILGPKWKNKGNEIDSFQKSTD